MFKVLMGLQALITIFLVIAIIQQDSKKPIVSQEGKQAYYKPKGKQAFLNKATVILTLVFFINALVMLKVK